MGWSSSIRLCHGELHINMKNEIQSSCHETRFIVQIDWSMGHIHNQGIQKDYLTKKLRTGKDYFEFLLYLLFHDYRGLIYDYN